MGRKKRIVMAEDERVWREPFQRLLELVHAIQSDSSVQAEVRPGKQVVGEAEDLVKQLCQALGTQKALRPKNSDGEAKREIYRLATNVIGTFKLIISAAFPVPHPEKSPSGNEQSVSCKPKIP